MYPMREIVSAKSRRSSDTEPLRAAGKAAERRNLINQLLEADFVCGDLFVADQYPK